MRNRKLTSAIFVLLIVQFVLGMLANLYSNIPAQHPASVFDQFGFILFHVLNAVVLLVLGIVLAVRSRRTPELKLAAGGLGGIVSAFVWGELFVFTQNDIFSLLMALSFMSAFIAYSRLFLAK